MGVDQVGGGFTVGVVACLRIEVKGIFYNDRRRGDLHLMIGLYTCWAA